MSERFQNIIEGMVARRSDFVDDRAFAQAITTYDLWRDAAFWSLLERSPFEHWTPGDAMPGGLFVMLFLETASRRDLALLDTIAEQLRKGDPGRSPRFAVITLREESQPAARLAEVFPGFGERAQQIVSLPAAGWWLDGAPVRIDIGPAVVEQAILAAYASQQRSDAPNGGEYAPGPEP